MLFEYNIPLIDLDYKPCDYYQLLDLIQHQIPRFGQPSLGCKSLQQYYHHKAESFYSTQGASMPLSVSLQRSYNMLKRSHKTTKTKPPHMTDQIWP